MCIYARLLTICLLTVFCLGVYTAQATEIIHSFDSHVVIRQDGTLRVTETLIVNAEGNRIKRGIYREFPLAYTGTGTHKGQVPFTVLSVVRDGHSLSATDVEYQSGNIRIYMREKDALLRPGQHTFVLTYETGRQARYYEKHDELNWNVTGANWAFPIERATCTITAPGPVEQTLAWVGVQGSKEQTDKIHFVAPNTVRFESDRALPPGQQMTVAVGFAKGLVAPEPPYEPGILERVNEALKTWGALLVVNPWYQAFLIVLGGAYFFGFWWARGRDPQKGTIIPLFHPPSMPGQKSPLSPAALVYIRDHKKLNPEGFAGLLLSLVLRGYASIKKEKKSFILKIRDGDSSTVSPEEQRVLQTLHTTAMTHNAITLDTDPVTREAFKDAKEVLEKNYAAATWHSNTGILALGWLVVVPVLFFAALLDVNIFIENVIMPLITLLMLSFIYMWRGIGIWTYGRNLLHKGCFAKICGILLLIPATLLVVGLIAWGCIVLAYMFVEADSIVLPCVTVLALLFTPLMKAPTALGRSLMDKIEGFTLFLKVAEKDRLAMLTKDGMPQDTPERFFNILPYAVALGQTKNWCARYADHIAAGLIVSDTLILYNWHTIDGITNFTHGLTQKVQTVHTGGATSAFSGSGGGGSGSGGGGGGGGGC